MDPFRMLCCLSTSDCLVTLYLIGLLFPNNVLGHFLEITTQFGTDYRENMNLLY